MNFYIKNYNSFIRLVKVIFTKEDNSLNNCDIADENIIIIDKEVLFLYDNYTISKKEFTNIDMLNNSDIILIKENGIVYRLFSFPSTKIHLANTICQPFANGLGEYHLQRDSAQAFPYFKG